MFGGLHKTVARSEVLLIDENLYEKKELGAFFTEISELRKTADVLQVSAEDSTARIASLILKVDCATQLFDVQGQTNTSLSNCLHLLKAWGYSELTRLC